MEPLPILSDSLCVSLDEWSYICLNFANSARLAFIALALHQWTDDDNDKVVYNKFLKDRATLILDDKEIYTLARTDRSQVYCMKIYNSDRKCHYKRQVDEHLSMGHPARHGSPWALWAPWVPWSPWAPRPMGQMRS